MTRAFFFLFGPGAHDQLLMPRCVKPNAIDIGTGWRKPSTPIHKLCSQLDRRSFRLPCPPDLHSFPSASIG